MVFKMADLTKVEKKYSIQTLLIYCMVILKEIFLVTSDNEEKPSLAEGLSLSCRIH